MSPVGGFILGALASPLILLALAYGFAFPGWVLAITGVLFALFAGAFVNGMLRPWPSLPGSTEASRTDAPRRPKR